MVRNRVRTGRWYVVWAYTIGCKRRRRMNFIAFDHIILDISNQRLFLSYRLVIPVLLFVLTRAFREHKLYRGTAESAA